MAEVSETTVPIRRVTVSSTRPFDDVVADVYGGLGRVPDFHEFVQRWKTAGGRDELDAMVAAVAGSSGLIEFLSLDHGEVLRTRAPERARRLLRVIAGNPVTMSKMTATAPDAGSYAPITILIAERDDGTTLSYDRVESLIAPYRSDEASTVAAALDESVVALLRHAAG
ncbi:MAG: DUF302 domain-containing protein [Mycobacterium sp.]